MSRFVFSLADERDDAALRRRMARDVLEGSIAVSFRREPSYFLGAAVQGERAQVIKCVDRRTGALAGMGARLVSPAWINGEARALGYLADLRGDPAYRGGTLLARGYRFLRELHEAQPVPLYYSVILEGNDLAIKTIASGRAGLPCYRPLGRMLTPAVHLDLPRRRIRQRGIHIETAREDNLDEVFRFINRQYAGKQFAPLYAATDLGKGRLRGLRARDIHLAIKGNRLVGVLAAWDQKDFRQTHVEKYSPGLARLRPFYNLLSRMTPLKALPAPGARVPYFYLALCAIADDDSAVFRQLLSHVYARYRKGPWHYFIAGLHEGHPLSAVLREYRRIQAAGQLFAVHYAEDQAAFDALDGRLPHVEMGAV